LRESEHVLLRNWVADATVPARLTLRVERTSVAPVKDIRKENKGAPAVFIFRVGKSAAGNGVPQQAAARTAKWS
jgi:hypothetical protein